jgi:hypothetical protein
MSNTLVMYILDCDHISPAPYIHALSIPLPCPRCDTKSHIADVHVFEWHATCNEDNCSWGKWCGTSKELAHRMVIMHYRNTKSHQGAIEYVKNPRAVKAQTRVRKALG